MFVLCCGSTKKYLDHKITIRLCKLKSRIQVQILNFTEMY